MIDVAVTGLSGVIGRQLALYSKYSPSIGELFHTKPYLTNPVQTFQIDLMAREQLTDVLKAWQPKILIHLAAATHLTHCQTQNGDKNGSVWQLNVEATRTLAETCHQLGIHLLFLSTEAVLSGKKDLYLENDDVDPISWYGSSKAAAEEIVRSVHPSSTIIRAVTAYDVVLPETIFGRVFSDLIKRKKISLVKDHFLTPTYIPDLIQAIDFVIDNQPSGVFHVTSPQIVTPYDFGKLVIKHHKLPEELVHAVNLETFLGEGSRIRTKYACLSSEKTEKQFFAHWKSPQQVIESLKLT